MPFTARGEPKIYYVEEGEQEPAIVLVHGWCCDHTFLAPQFEHFKKSRRVVAVDLRGCGRTGPAQDGYHMDRFADDLVTLAQELELDSPVVVGHSMGGGIALEVAARYPTLTSAVVAIDPGPINPTPEARLVFEGFAHRMEGPAGDAVRRAWVEEDPIRDRETRRRIVETMCSVPIEVAVASLRGTTVDWNSMAALNMCPVPLLVIRANIGGSNDPARLRSLKPEIHLALTVGRSHFNQLEVPEQVNAMIEGFLDEVLQVRGV